MTRTTAPPAADAPPAAEPDADDAAPDDATGRARPGRRWRAWWARLVAGGCVLWLLLVVLHIALTGRVYWWSPVELAPPVAFVLVPAALLLLALTARPLRTALAVVVLAAAVLGAPYAGLNLRTLGYSPPPAPADAITLVSWNTEYWDQDLQPGDARSTADFYAFLRGLDADVYLLQEYAHVDTTREDVFSQALAIDQEDLLRDAFPEHEIVVAGRNITLSRLPVSGHEPLPSTPWLPRDLRDVPPGLADRPLFYHTQTLRTDIELGAETVSFYNSHVYQPPQRILRLRSDADRSMFEIDRFTFEMRRASFEAVASDVAGNDQRAVWAGDLNTSAAMGLLRQAPAELDDRSPALSSVYPATWPASRPLWRIDWLFTSPDVEVGSYDLLDPGGLSDHKVQRVRLWLD